MIPFLLGVIATASLVATMFFVKFWLRTRDPLFLAFAFFFTTEALARVVRVSLERPNEGTPEIYVLRLAASILILLAILVKNLDK